MTIKTAKDAIDTASGALDLYNKVLDQTVPWNGIKDQITKLDTDVTACSRENANHIGSVKTQLLNVIDEYDSATQAIYEWCGLSTSLLNTYIALFTNNTESKQKLQKKFMANVLDHGIKNIQKAQGKLDQCINYFNLTSGHLASLESCPIKENLTPTVDKALIDTKQTKEKLDEKLQKMNELKTQIGDSEPYVVDDAATEGHHVVIESAQQFIANCNQYRDHHKN